MRSTIYQMRAHFTKCIRIWPLSVSLTKCAAHLGKCATQLPNARAFGQMSRVSSIGQMRSACAAQMRSACAALLAKCTAHLAKCADWSNAPYIVTRKQKRVQLTTTPGFCSHFRKRSLSIHDCSCGSEPVMWSGNNFRSHLLLLYEVISDVVFTNSLR